MNHGAVAGVYPRGGGFLELRRHPRYCYTSSDFLAPFLCVSSQGARRLKAAAASAAMEVFGTVMTPRKATWLIVLGVALAGVQLAAEAQWVWSPQTGRWINLRRLPQETAELQLEQARSLYLEGDYREAMNQTDLFIDFYSNSEVADQNQFLRGEIELARGRPLRAAEEFQKTVDEHPATQLFPDVMERQYAIADDLYERGLERLEHRNPFFRERPLRQAIDVYTMVIDNQPFATAAAEAQYKLGRCYFALERYIEAAFEFQRVIEDYPQSEWVADANHGLAQCYYYASLPPAYNQAPSRRAIAAVETFQQRFPGDERTEELGEIRDEMRERLAEQRLRTAHYYERRREFGSARIYYQVVVEQFAGTEAAEAAQDWLSNHPDAGVTPASLLD